MEIRNKKRVVEVRAKVPVLNKTWRLEALLACFGPVTEVSGPASQKSSSVSAGAIDVRSLLGD